MRTYFKTTEVPKRIAKAIAHVFPALNLAKAQEWTAKMCGYRDWHELDMFTRNFTSEPTPDPFLVEYQEAFEKYLNNLDSHEEEPEELETRGKRKDFQIDVLQELMSVHKNIFFTGDCHSEIMWCAHHGLSGLACKKLGKGSPLFNDLQYPWFQKEDEAQVPHEEGEIGDEFLSTQSIDLMCGFASYHQFNRWILGAKEKWNKEELAEFREEFPGVLQRVGGGSYIRLNNDNEGREVIVQSTIQRFWWRRSSDNRMLGGFTLTARVVSRREDSAGDEFEFCIHDTWYDKLVTTEQRDATLWPVPIGDATEMLTRFIRTRIGMDSLSCRIVVAYDQREGSRELSDTLRGVVNDFASENTGVDIDPCFDQQVVPYSPKYLAPTFFAFESQLV